MGADYLSATAPMPCDSQGNLDLSTAALAVITRRIETLDVDSLAETDEVCCGGMCTPQEIRDTLKSTLAELIGYRRDTSIEFDGRRHIITTGGMSWGDSPTEAFNGVCMLAASGVTRDRVDADTFDDVAARRAVEAILTQLAEIAPEAAPTLAALPASSRAALATTLRTALNG